MLIYVNLLRKDNLKDNNCDKMKEKKTMQKEKKRPYCFAFDCLTV